jgi:hypothetical protein
LRAQRYCEAHAIAEHLRGDRSNEQNYLEAAKLIEEARTNQ